MQLLPEQITASDPNRNIWLSANAGTGKTYVLVNRFLRLILEGNSVERILCITYTKAAAAEMHKRIIETIGSMIILDDNELKARLEKDFKENIDIKKLGTTKRKLAEIIDHPEQLKIQTIHSFCQTILKSFPLEVGIPPFFNVIDDNKKTEIIDESWNRLIIDINSAEDESIRNAFAELVSRLQIFSIKKLFQNLFEESEQIGELVNEHGGLGNYIEFLKERLGVGNDNIIDIEAELYHKIEGFLPALADALAQGGKTQHGILKNLVNYLKTRKIDDIKIVFLTEKDTPRSSIFNKELKSNYPLVFENINIWTEEIIKHLNEIKNAEIFLITKCTLILFTEFAKIFERTKKLKYLLDYDDLIQKTAALLDKNNINSQWVLYKLDGGIDHILLDEAQDTNTKQWKVIDAITAEFFSYAGSESKINRSLFVVGDEKQSIYSFQGANIETFSGKKDNFEYFKTQNRTGLFEVVSLNTSFRSCEAILTIVDKVLRNEKVKNSVTDLNEINTHKLSRDKDFGYFEINELVDNIEKKATNKDNISWHLPQEYIVENELKIKEIAAEKIAKRIEEILNRDFVLASTGKRPLPEDIMILLKKRDELSHLIIKKLQERNIPVSGMDRLRLSDNLAIKDIIALGKFTILENDDLNFACLLKSPIFEISEDELFELCWNRGKKSVYGVLQEKTGGNKKYKYICELIDKIKNGDGSSAFSFYFSAIEVLGLRKKFNEYFGNQVNEILNEFLNIVKNYENDHSPSMQQFIGWFEKSDIEIKRNIKTAGGEVKILTVHGAKGLESPIVILPDTTSVGQNSTQYIFSDDGVFLCPVQKDYRNQMFEDILAADKSAADAEYYRLLYVALTRPRDELYVFGHKSRGSKADNWHNIIIISVNDICEKVEDRFVYTSKAYIGNKVFSEIKNNETKKILEFGKLEKDELLEVLSPSKLYKNSDDKKIKSVNIDFDKGIAVHKLLEILPDIEKVNRDNVAEIILKDITQLNDEQKNIIKNEAYSVMDNKGFESIFSSRTKAEVPVCGILEKKFISGKIDRLIETKSEIIIIDYKTNRVNDTNLSKLVEGYRPQLEAYKNILQKIYKDKKIKTALLFTSINKLVYLDE